MSVTTDMGYAEIDATLRLARREINRQEPDQAISYLKAVRDMIEGYKERLIWVEYHLLIAEAYAAKYNPAAEDLFETVRTCIGQTAEANAEIRFRFHRSYGVFLSRQKLWRRALEHYELAEPYAIEWGAREELADLNLKIIEAQLQVKKDPKVSSLRGLRAVGYKRHCTAQKILSAWRLFERRSNEVRAQAVFLRETQVPEAAYFEELIDEAGEESGEG
jgi:hypothetical protein